MKGDKISQFCIILLISITSAVMLFWRISPNHHGLLAITWIIAGGGAFFLFYRKMYGIIKNHNIEQVIFLLLVFCLIVLPATHINFAEKDAKENRTLAVLPEINLSNFYKGHLTKDIEGFFNDRFRGRMALLQLHKNVVNLFGNKRLENEKAIEGKDNWIFYKPDRYIELYQNKFLYEPGQYETIKNNLEQQRKWFAEHGIAYFYIIPPNKSDIYGENLVGINKMKEPDFERIGLLEKYLTENNAYYVPVFPLTAFKEYKKKHDELLYYKTDTHWAELGAYIGYLELMKQVKVQYPDLPVLSEDIMTFEKTKKYDNGDLAILLDADFTDEMVGIDYVVPEPMNGWHYEIVEENKNQIGWRMFFRTINPQGRLKVMVFRDSFGTNFAPYLSETFHEVLYYWDYAMDKHIEDILREKPDIVITESGSRLADYVLFNDKLKGAGK